MSKRSTSVVRPASAAMSSGSESSRRPRGRVARRHSVVVIGELGEERVRWWGCPPVSADWDD